MFAELGAVPFPRSSLALSRRGYNVPISIALAPVADRFVPGRRATEAYGVLTLVAGRALAISVVEYGTELHFAHGRRPDGTVEYVWPDRTTS